MSEHEDWVWENDLALRFGVNREVVKKIRQGSMVPGVHFEEVGKRVRIGPQGVAVLVEAVGLAFGVGDDGGGGVSSIVEAPGGLVVAEEISSSVQDAVVPVEVAAVVEREMEAAREIEVERQLSRRVFDVKVVRVWPERKRQVLGLFEGKKVRVDVQDAGALDVGMVLPCERRHDAVFVCRKRLGGKSYERFYRSTPR